MIKNHALLDWLTPEQALASLQESVDSKMTLQDLFSHCLQGNCYAYIKATGVKGEFHGAYSHPSSYELSEVTGIGYQMLTNPQHLGHSTAYIAEFMGDVVCSTGNPVEPEKISNIEWHALITPHMHPPFFKKSGIQKLIKDIAAEPSGGPSTNTLLITIGALLELMTTSGRENKSSIEGKILAKYSGKRGLGERTLQKVFARASEALDKADAS
ncbi:MAG: hypothetical protein CFE49_01185 [Pseudomonas sp. PGPPP3]|nr:MAG: hypothetical protein CFE49_01185 [Pseudomonas sp. PGPPP3]